MSVGGDHSKKVIWSCFFPNALQGFPFHSGGLGVEDVFARRCGYGRNRPQPFATVRKRSREGRMAVPMVSSAEGMLFIGFKLLVASFRVAGVALRDIQTYFVTCRKSFCLAGAILLGRCLEDALHFSWQAQCFGRVHRHFAWQAQHFRL